MRAITETKILYVSDDGKLKSSSESEVLQYEEHLVRKNFYNRTKVCNCI